MIYAKICLRRGTAAEWTSANPTLALGEAGFETDTLKMKVGDGATAWTGLSYIVATGSSISDGDKGDITVSSSGAVWTIDNDAVSYAKIQNVSATDRILGRSSGGAGDIEEITCTSAARSILDDASVSAMRTTLGAAATASPTFTGTVTLPAGAGAGAGVLMQSGTVATSPAAGAHEYDGTAFYGTNGQSQRGQFPHVQIMYLTAAYTLTSTTATQKAFNSPTNGRFAAKAGKTYRFKCRLSLASLSASSGAVAFGFDGTATVTKINWHSVGIKANQSAANTSTANSNHVNTTSLSVEDATTANTGTQASILAEGLIIINSAGTLIPSVALEVAAAATVESGSFFEIWEIPGNTGDFS